jgi:glycosyltransferase EpsF
MRKKLGLDGKFVVGHVGRFVPQKNHTFLIDIFTEVVKKRHESVLLLVGDGPLREKTEQKVAKLGLSEKVLFLGQCADTPALMMAMDVFVLPSLYEGLPVVGIEAQAAGLPCMLSDEMTAETKVLDKTIFVPFSNSTAQWAEAIMQTYSHEKHAGTIDRLRSAHFDIMTEAGILKKTCWSTIKVKD